ncbi:MAG: 30S ribosomal protein S8 [Candidatus Paceibacterota bacterium]|jgi:small subunit ribosomal protein S8
MVTDTIGDLIIRLKNANLAGKESISLYTSKNKFAVAEALKRAGFVKSVSKSKNEKMLDIELSYKSGKQPKIAEVQRVSKPSRRIYKGVADIKPFKNGFGATFISTPAGILSDKEAIKQKVGGEVLFRVW